MASRTWVLGITGGIGSGKTTVTKAFSELGITVVDSDIIAREVVEPNSKALEEIQQRYGMSILNSDGTLNRAKLREHIFSNIYDNKESNTEKAWLESLLHPLIRERTEKQLNAANGPYVILSSPLLLETDQHTLVDRILVVDLPEDIQIQRASARDNTDTQHIKTIMANQLSRKERLAEADDVIDNSRKIESTRDQVLALHHHYVSLTDTSDL